MIYLGFKNLIHDRGRLTITLVGVTFAVVLMLVQSGIYFGYLNSVSGMVDRCPADLWICAGQTLNADTARAIPEDTVLAVRGTPGIEWADRVILAWAGVQLADGTRTWAQVTGFNPDTGIGGPPEMIEGSVAELRRPGTYVIDEASLPLLPGVKVGDKIEAFGQKIEIVGICRGAKSYNTYAVMFASYRTTQDQLVNLDNRVSFVVAKFDGSDREVTMERLRRIRHMDIYTRGEFHEKVRDYWESRTGIGLGIGLTMILGFIVGLVIVGQTMYSATVDRLREYATLKAMGASTFEICGAIWTQAVIVGLVGFGLGSAIAMALTLTGTGAIISIDLTPTLFGGIFVATFVMCLGASLLSIAKVLRVDPATVFRT